MVDSWAGNRRVRLISADGDKARIPAAVINAVDPFFNACMAYTGKAIRNSQPFRDILLLPDTLFQYGGIAFQIQDDILDVTSTTEVLGKPVHSDEKNQKVTYVSICGIEQSGKNVEQYSREAIALLDELNKNTDFLRQLIIQLINREK